MDCLTVGQRYHAEDARRGFAGTRNLAPEADAAIRLLLATDRGGDDLGTPSRINVGTLVDSARLRCVVLEETAQSRSWIG